MSSADVAELYAFRNLYTFDPDGWEQTGTLCETLAMVHHHDLQAADFIPVKHDEA